MADRISGRIELLPDGALPFEGGVPTDGVDIRRLWFPLGGVNEQNRFNVLQSDIALVGFSQGAIMALEFSVAHGGHAGISRA